MQLVQAAQGVGKRVARTLRSKKRWAAATLAVVAVITALATVALGSDAPSQFGIAGSQIFVTADLDETIQWNSDRVKFQTKGPTDVRVQKLVVAPGGYSGWHHHPGIVIVVVESGDITFTHADCSTGTYGPGQPNGDVFVEGGDTPGQASSVNGATLYVTYVAPDGAGFRINDHDFQPPTCP